MNQYEVTIREYLERTVQIKANSKEEAIVEVQRQWDKGEMILTADDFTHAEFSAKSVRERNEER